MASKLKWLGRQVSEKLRRAQVAGVNATMSAAVIRARRNHPWSNRTATLEGAIDIADYAAPAARGVRGVWGVRDVVYARIHELGGVIRPVRARALTIVDRGEIVAVVQEVTLPARPYLRPAADAEYPGLAGRIRTAFERGEA